MGGGVQIIQKDRWLSLYTRGLVCRSVIKLNESQVIYDDFYAKLE